MLSRQHEPRPSGLAAGISPRSPEAPIEISQGEAGQLIVRVPYTPERVSKIKTISGRRWHPEEKYWSVPQTPETIDQLVALFAGEPVSIAPPLKAAHSPIGRVTAPPPARDHLEAPTVALLEQVRQAIRAKHYSDRTEEAYLGWIRRFVLFHHQRHPAEMSAPEVSRFLTSLAVDRDVAASTQNQALAAILFLYKDVLDRDPGWVEGVVRAKRPQRLPVVLSREEVHDLLSALDGVAWISGATWNTVASGVNLTSYTLNPVQSSDHGARFRANVCNQLGMQLNCIASNVATLTVTPATTPPVFTQQPQSISVVEGQTASFTAVASGNPAPSVQWYRVASPDVAAGAPCAAGTGTTTSCTYTTPALAVADSGTQYYALAQNSVGNTQSNTATVTVTAAAVAPSITTQPTDQTVTVGGSATFTVVADGTAPLSYQWYRNGAAVTGANTATLVLTNVQLAENGDQYYVVVSNSEGAATSVTVTLTVTPSAAACNVPQLLESGAGHAGGPQIALDASGNAIAVWQQNDGTFLSIYANRYAAGSGWGNAQLIESAAGDAYEPRIAMDASGNAITIWWDQYDRTYANRYAAGSGWGTAQLLESSSGNPDVAMDTSGDAIAVWQLFDGSTDSIYASRYSSGSGWSAPQPIENGAGSAINARIAVDGSGNAIAVWSQSNGTSYNLTANRYTQGIGWGTAQPIETLSREADAADIAMNASGDAVVVWRDRVLDGNGNLVDAPVYAIRYTPGSGWGTAQRLDSGTNYWDVPYPPQVAIDANGNAIAVWRDHDGAGFRVFARRYVAGSGWAAIEELQSPSGGDVWYPPDVAMDANGNAIVVWMQWQTNTFGIFGNRYTPGSGWGGATLVANATIDVGWPRVALNGSGTAIAVWHEGDGTTYNVKAVRCP